MRKLNRITGTLLVTGFLLTAPLTSLAAAARAKGVLSDVNLDASTVTIETRRGASLTLQVNARTVIERNGAPARLDDLQLRDQVTASYDSETLVARKIVARGPDRDLARIRGAISNVDVAASTLTIVASDGSDPVTLVVTSDTGLTLDDRSARLSDLQRGFSASAIYDASSFEALRVNASSFQDVAGVIRDVDLESRMITISPRGDIPPVTLSVTAETGISLDGRPATLEDLRPGYRAEALYLAGALVAARISAVSRAEALGTIRSVDTVEETVTIIPHPDGAPLTLDVVNSTDIMIGDQRATLDRLQPGMTARAVYNIATLVAIKIEARAQRRSR